MYVCVDMFLFVYELLCVYKHVYLYVYTYVCSVY